MSGLWSRRKCAHTPLYRSESPNPTTGKVDSEESTTQIRPNPFTRVQTRSSGSEFAKPVSLALGPRKTAVLGVSIIPFPGLLTWRLTWASLNMFDVVGTQNPAPASHTHTPPLARGIPAPTLHRHRHRAPTLPTHVQCTPHAYKKVLHDHFGIILGEIRLNAIQRHACVSGRAPVKVCARVVQCTVVRVQHEARTPRRERCVSAEQMEISSCQPRTPHTHSIALPSPTPMPMERAVPTPLRKILYGPTGSCVNRTTHTHAHTRARMHMPPPARGLTHSFVRLPPKSSLFLNFLMTQTPNSLTRASSWPSF